MNGVAMLRLERSIAGMKGKRFHMGLAFGQGRAAKKMFFASGPLTDDFENGRVSLFVEKATGVDFDKERNKMRIIAEKSQKNGGGGN